MSRIVHFEITAENIERAVAFYEQAFGWRIEKWSGPFDYWMIMTGPEDQPGIDGGVFLRTKEPPGAVNTIGVESIDEALEKIVAHGGKIVNEKMPLPGVGLLAYVEDPEGNSFGILQPEMPS